MERSERPIVRQTVHPVQVHLLVARAEQETLRLRIVVVNWHPLHFIRCDDDLVGRLGANYVETPQRGAVISTAA